MTLSQQSLDQKLEHPVRYFGSVDSTNDIAMQWLSDGAEQGSVVIADEQRRGRGRQGRFWYTPPGVALAASIILRPSQEWVHRVSMIGALAVVDLCESLNIGSVGIKWPNDVQISGKKVSGILPEAAWEDATLQGVVLGIGVNVRVEFTEDLLQIATNIETAYGSVVNRTDLVATLVRRVLYWADRSASDELFHTWSARLNMIGQEVQVGSLVGKAQGVDQSGALLIKTRDGSIKSMMAGDVSLSQ